MKTLLLVVLATVTGIVLSGCQKQSVPAQNSVPTQQGGTQSGSSENGSPIYTLDQVAQHNSKSDCWLVVNDSVYDVTSFIPNHPGGNEILKGCGRDATLLFSSEREHDEKAFSKLTEFEIGTVAR